MREEMIEALRKHAEGHIEKHKLNVEVILQKPVGIGDHDKLLEVVKDRFNKLTCAKHSLDELEKIINVKEETKGKAEGEAKTKTKT